MTEHGSAAASSSHHHHEHDHDHDPVKPGIDTAECPVMPGQFVAKRRAEARGWVRHYAERTY